MLNFTGMRTLKNILDFYIEGSIHVALSVFALIQVTCIRLDIPFDFYVSGFAFFGTIVGYNFVKYDALARNDKPKASVKLRSFIAVSALSFVACVYFFIGLQPATQIVSVLVLFVTALYTLSFFPDKKNARNWAGLKIYFVAISWVGVTVALPVLDSATVLGLDFYITCVQRFIVVVVLLFIFEIIDLAWDDPHLHTVPQQIGVKQTKVLGMSLLCICLVLDVIKQHPNAELLWCNVAMVIAVSLCLFISHEKRSRYFTTFWVEGITVIWWLSMEWAIRS